MIEGIKAIAFDIDGTLYPGWRLYVRLFGYFFRHILIFHDFNEVRKVLHRTAPLADFYEYQARLFAERRHVSVEEARDVIQSVCYEGLRPYFTNVKSYKNVYDAVCAFKAAGLKIAILSDFPPEQKGRLWGVRELCDVCIGSEESGALKPSKYPFGILALKLGLKSEEILYVGNHPVYDVLGAHNAGMKTAFFIKGFRRLLHIRPEGADICFKSYRQLRNLVLQ